MARQDYSDEEDFYTQGFRQPGVVSVWLGLSAERSDPSTDVLQDLCGVGYYSLDDQEANSTRPSLSDVGRLLDGISYADSFRADVIARAQEMMIPQARWITVQFDFAYVPDRVTRPIADDPRFIGVFRYSPD